MFSPLRLPSPALVIACLALLVALGGTAVAAGVVPLAKRALVADNAKKLQGKTATQLTAEVASGGGRASSAAGLFYVKQSKWFAEPGKGLIFVVPCGPGEKAVSGGFEDPNGYAFAADSHPLDDSSAWMTSVFVSKSAPGPQGGPLYTTCVK
jgi:hypothetical protein